MVKSYGFMEIQEHTVVLDENDPEHITITMDYGRARKIEELYEQRHKGYDERAVLSINEIAEILGEFGIHLPDLIHLD